MTDPDASRPPDEKDAVYYDGSCPMCRMIVSKIGDSSEGGRYSMKNIDSEPLPQNFNREDVEKEMHVVGADGAVYKNAAAILKLLEVFPAWKLFVRVGRLPIVREILPFGYNFVAANRRFLFGPAARIYWLKVLICLGFICGIALSPKLWVSSRFYPLTPVANLFSIPYPFDWAVLLVLLGLLSATVLTSRPIRFIWSAVGVVSLLVFLDQQRLQPWVYQYVFMLAGLGLFSWKFDDVDGKNATLNICRFIVASIYFWSGLQKVNRDFVNGDFPWMIASIEHLLPASWHLAIHLFSMFVPFIEMGIGIGLLIGKFRTVAITFALAMCALVLSAIGPFGHNWNPVVWPWNITMALLVLILFAGTKTVSMREILWVENRAFHKLIVVLFGLLPGAYFFNVWDSYMSWSLHSSTTNVAALYMSNSVSDRLPSYLQRLVMVDNRGRNMLPIAIWALSELNVPAYPEARIFKSVAEGVCKATSNPPDLILAMRGRLSWFYAEKPQIFNCDQLTDRDR